MSKTVQKSYAIKGRTLEDVLDQVRLILSYDGEISKVVITNGNITAEYVVDDNEGPPYGKLPDDPAREIGDVIAKIRLENVKSTNDISIDSLAVIASALIQARKSSRVGVAWLLSDSEVFRKWLGVTKPVSKLLEVPVYEVDSDKVPEDKLILLCGRTSAVSLLKCDFGILMNMKE